jgi:tetratricopeptide (TPR) repeat protein
MIVRDEADRIARCVQRHLGLADEIVVVDTGSRDGTAGLAQEAGARVVPFEWRDDFAAARNASLEAARGRWTLILDADEWIEEEDFAKVRELCGGGAPEAAYTIATRTYMNDAGQIGWEPCANPPADAADFTGFLTSWKVRLFPLRRDIRFEGEIHELVESSVERAGLRILPCGAIVHHRQTERELDPAALRRKQERYLRLSRAKVERNPADPKALYELGMIAYEMELFQESASAFSRAASAAPHHAKGSESAESAENTESAQSMVMYAAALLRLKDFQGVRDFLLSRMDTLQDSAVGQAALGEALQALGDIEGAEKAFQRSLEIRPDFFHALVHIGNLCMATNRPLEALRHFGHAVEVNPKSEIASTNAGICAAALGLLDQARGLLETSCLLAPQVWLPHYYLGQIAQVEGRYSNARAHYETALQLDPRNPRVREALNSLP